MAETCAVREIPSGGREFNSGLKGPQQRRQTFFAIVIELKGHLSNRPAERASFGQNYPRARLDPLEYVPTEDWLAQSSAKPVKEIAEEPREHGK